MRARSSISTGNPAHFRPSWTLVCFGQISHEKDQPVTGRGAEGVQLGQRAAIYAGVSTANQSCERQVVSGPPAPQCRERRSTDLETFPIGARRSRTTRLGVPSTLVFGNIFPSAGGDRTEPPSNIDQVSFAKYARS